MTGSVVAVVTGYLVFGASAAVLFNVSGRDPRATPSIPFAAGSIAYGIFFAGLAGYVAASLAPRQPRRHAALLAIIIATIALVSMVFEFQNGSVWSQLATLLLMAPAAVVGGWLRTR